MKANSNEFINQNIEYFQKYIIHPKAWNSTIGNIRNSVPVPPTRLFL